MFVCVHRDSMSVDSKWWDRFSPDVCLFDCVSHKSLVSVYMCMCVFGRRMLMQFEIVPIVTYTI